MSRDEEAMTPEAGRLEALWTGEFGASYLERNADAGAGRDAFWTALLGQYPVQRVLEVGCNTGANLQWIAPRLAPGDTYGVDVNRTALERARARFPDVNTLVARATDLPFRDRWFDLSFTTGVLIHLPEDSVAQAMAEIVRVSRRYVLCGEYHAPEPVEVPYRGMEGALFKRDYGGMYQAAFPELRLVDEGFLGKDAGWDDVTWWLFERT